MSDIDNYLLSYNGSEIITEGAINPTLNVPGAETDLPFYQTRQTLLDPERYKSFIKNAERRFRASREYKHYKGLLMSMGMDHCQIMGNIEQSDGVEIELHHNVLNLFDIFIMICEHILNTVGYISTFDLICLVIQEHYQNNVGCTFLSVTAHEIYTADHDAYIPPNMTWGRWWNLLSKYKYGVTYDIAQKVTRYINKYAQQLPTSVVIEIQEQVLNFAYYNTYGTPSENLYISSSDMMYTKQIETKEITPSEQYMIDEYGNFY